MTTMTITNNKLDQFTVRLVPIGDPLYSGLTQRPDRARSEWEQDRVMVEFYDAEFAGRKGFSEFGQFISSYGVPTLLEGVIKFVGLSAYSFDEYAVRGINLYGGEPKWRIGSDAMKVVLRWIVHELETNHHMGTTWLPQQGVQIS